MSTTQASAERQATQAAEASASSTWQRPKRHDPSRPSRQLEPSRAEDRASRRAARMQAGAELATYREPERIRSRMSELDAQLTDPHPAQVRSGW